MPRLSKTALNFVLAIVLVLSIFSLVSKASAKVEKLVNNLSTEFPDFLSKEEELRLETKLVEFNAKTSNQLCIVIVDSFAGLDENEFSTKLFNELGIGTKDKDNGILILIKPTEKEGGRKVYISTGYGLEAAIPDIKAKEIIEKIIVPNFKAKKYYLALDEASSILMSLAATEYAEKLQVKGKDKSALFLLVFLIPVFFILFSEIFLSKTGERIDISKNGSRRLRSDNYISPIIPFPYLGHSPQQRHNHIPNFMDFGGFGGGSSGGGGAGGEW